MLGSILFCAVGIGGPSCSNCLSSTAAGPYYSKDGRGILNSIWTSYYDDPIADNQRDGDSILPALLMTHINIRLGQLGAIETQAELESIPGAPSRQRIPTLGPKVHTYDLPLTTQAIILSPTISI